MIVSGMCCCGGIERPRTKEELKTAFIFPAQPEKSTHQIMKVQGA